MLSAMTKSEKCSASNAKFVEIMKKDVTLEFSRDRKSMSVFCTPLTETRGSMGPKLFVKVHLIFSILNCYLKLIGRS